jgi:hypothetical protein
LFGLVVIVHLTSSFSLLCHITMPITKLKLSWPRDVPTDEEIEAMMALREDVGEDRVLRSPKGTCDGYQTAIWNTTEGMVDMESSVTLPVHYKSHWDQLIYSIMYCYHVYSWLKSWKERTNSDNSLLAASMEIHAKYLRYLSDVKTKIKSDAVNLSTVESDARISVFDEYIIKERWDLHQTSRPDLASRVHRLRFTTLDIVRDAEQLSEF